MEQGLYEFQYDGIKSSRPIHVDLPAPTRRRMAGSEASCSSDSLGPDPVEVSDYKWGANREVYDKKWGKQRMHCAVQELNGRP